MKPPICSRCNKPMKFDSRGYQIIQGKRETWDTYKCDCGRSTDRRVK